MEFNTKMINSKVGLLSYAWFVGGDELYEAFYYYIGDDEIAQDFVQMWDGKEETLSSTLTQMIDEFYKKANYI